MTMELSPKSVAGFVALTGKALSIEDAYHLGPSVPYSINRKFDEDSGYRTKSMLVVPMRNQKDEIVGVVQLLNAKRDPRARLDSIGAVTRQVVPSPAVAGDRYPAQPGAVALENLGCTRPSRSSRPRAPPSPLSRPVTHYQRPFLPRGQLRGLVEPWTALTQRWPTSTSAALR
jgi:hypothetical protein